jgi:hypothetical protein
MEKFDSHLIEAMKFAVLYKNGGIVSDPDLLWVSPQRTPRNHHVIGSYAGVVSTKFMKIVAEHPFLVTLFNITMSNILESLDGKICKGIPHKIFQGKFRANYS